MLGKVGLFTGLTPDALQAIASITSEQSHSLGTKIFSHGDPGDRFFLILEGKVRVSRNVSGMGEEALAVLGPGDAFCELCFVDMAPRVAHVVLHHRARDLAGSE